MKIKSTDDLRINSGELFVISLTKRILYFSFQNLAYTMKTFSRYEQGVDFKAPTWSCSRQETPSDPMKASSWPETQGGGVSLQMHLFSPEHPQKKFSGQSQFKKPQTRRSMSKAPLQRLNGRRGQALFSHLFLGYKLTFRPPHQVSSVSAN